MNNQNNKSEIEEEIRKELGLIGWVDNVAVVRKLKKLFRKTRQQGISDTLAVLRDENYDISYTPKEIEERLQELKQKISKEIKDEK